MGQCSTIICIWLFMLFFPQSDAEVSMTQSNQYLYNISYPKIPKSEDKDLLSSSAPFARHILVLFCWGKNVLAGELSQDYRMGKDEKHVAKLFYEKHASIEGEKAPWSSVPCICHHALCLPGQHAQIHRDQVDPYIGKSGTSKLTKFHFNMLFQTLAHMID